MGVTTVYSENELLKKLRYLLDKYGKVTSYIIDNEPGFPTRKVFVRVFGSVNNALNKIGMYKKKGKFTKEDAQERLNARNANFDLLEFSSMRNKNLTRCKKCGYVWNVATDSLLRNNTYTHGCPNCFRISKMKPLKEKVDTKKYKLRKLLDESLQSYYVLGFIMADGHIDNSKRLRICISEKDSEILYNIREFLGDDICIRHQKRNNTVCMSVMDTYTIGILSKRYSISERKTYGPCNISKIHGDKLTAFIIGYIDGDGCLTHRTDTHAEKYTIKVHKNWEQNLKIISEHLYKVVGIDRYPIPTDIIQGNKVYTSLSIGNRKVIQYLKTFISNNNIKVLTRKWEQKEMMLDE